MPSIKELAIMVCDYLDKHDLEYVIVGGLANNHYGIIRITGSMDILVRLQPRACGRFIRFLNKIGLAADQDELVTALNERSHFSAVDRTTGLWLDIKGVSTELEKRMLRNHRTVDYHGTAIHLASPEDIIAIDLSNGVPQDIKDAEGILLRQHERLDMEYLHRTCSELKVRRKLDAIRKRLRPIKRKKKPSARSQK